MMMDKQELAKICTKEIDRILGKEYVREHLDTAAKGIGMLTDDYFGVSIGIKTKDDTPDLKPNYEGWTVYAFIVVDANTGNVFYRDYQTEDGKVGEQFDRRLFGI